MIYPIEKKDSFDRDRINIIIEEINTALKYGTGKILPASPVSFPTSISDNSGSGVQSVGGNISFTDDGKVNVDAIAADTMYVSIDEAVIDHDALLNFEAGEHYPVIDEDDMVSDSDAYVPTQQSVKAYVDAAGGGSPGGSDTQVQYNNGGAFGGASALTYDDSNNRLGINLTDPACPLEVGVATGSAIIISDSDVSGAANRIRGRLYISGSGSGLLYLYDNTPLPKVMLYPGGVSYVDGVFAIGSTGSSVSADYKLYIYNVTNGGIYVKTGGDCKIELDSDGAAGNNPIIYFRKHSGGTSNIYASVYGDDDSGLTLAVAGDYDFRVYTNTVKRFQIDSSGLEISDAHDIIVGTTTGTIIGTTTSQKLGFWGTTPVIQPSTISDPSGVTTDEDVEARSSIEAIIDLLQSVGMMA